jgi:hypothetical protein
VRACVLVSNAARNINGTPHNPAPHLFFVLERRQNVKPSGWEFLNPLAPSAITADIFNRWRLRGIGDPAFTPGTPESTLFQVGAPLTKNIAAYWEVNLDQIAAEDLQQFDIAYIGLRGTVAAFTPEQREKLRKFVDSGGVLWLENLGGGGINPQAPFLLDVQFSGNFPANSRPFLDTTQRQHAMVRFPFTLSQFEILGLGAGSANNRQPHNASTGGVIDPRIMTPVVLTRDAGNTLRPYISAGEYGSGRLIVSSAGLADGIAGFVGGANVEGPNSGVVSGFQLIAARPVDLKFAYNLVSWGSATTTAGINPRRTSGSDERIGSNLARKWSTIPTTVNGLGSGAIIHKGILFSVDGNNILHAYDANPGQDLDGDNNPDEGITDFILGAPFDEIWNVRLNTAGIPDAARVSTPSVMSVFDPAFGTRDILVLTTSEGRTVAFNALPRTASGQLSRTPQLLWGVFPAAGNLAGSLLLDNPLAGPLAMPAPTPAINEGIIFTIAIGGATPDAPWRIMPLRPDGTNAFGIAGVMAPFPGNLGGTQIEGMPDITGPLTAGYVRDEGTGALDLMIYAPTRPFINTPSGVVQGVWFRTRNEPLQPLPGDATRTRFRPAGERARVPWFVPQNPAGVEDLMPVVTIVARNVQGVVTGTERIILNTAQVSYGGAMGNREITVTLPRPLLENETVFADYVLNWPAAPLTGAATMTADEMRRFGNRRQFRLVTSGPQPPPVFVSGQAALTAQDLLVFNGIYGNPVLPSRTYGLREQFSAGGNQTRRRRGNGTEVAWMWGPHVGGTFGTSAYLPRLVNRDTFQPGGQSGRPIGQVVTQFQAIGSPAIANNTAYIVGTAQLQGNGGGPATVILALRANPPMTFSIGRPIPGNAIQLRVRQLDPVNSVTGVGGERFITLTENVNFFADRDSGTISITNAREPNGEVLNNAMPVRVQISVPGSSTPEEVEVRDPRTGLGPLDNLLWYMIIPSEAPNAPNAVLPPELRSILPSSGATVSGDVLYFGTTDGHVVSLELLNAPSGGAQYLIYGQQQPRIAKMRALNDTNNNAIAQPIIHPPIGFGNTIAAAAPRGVAALENRITLIADTARLLQVDSRGNAVWTLDTTRSFALSGGAFQDGTGQLAINRVRLARPSVAHLTELDQYVVCDTGNNRVAQVDRGGTLNWEIRNLNDGMQFLRPGDPISLNAPSDVQIFSEGTDNTANVLTIVNPTVRLPGGAFLTYTYTGAYFATHYLIADSGNYRIVEIMDAFDPNGNPIVLRSNAPAIYPDITLLRQLVFVTRNVAEQNERYRYRTIQQFQTPGPGGSVLTFLVAAIDNQRAAAVDPTATVFGSGGVNGSGPGGSIVSLRRYPPVSGPLRDGDLASVVSTILVREPNNPNPRRQTISNPAWFKQFNVRAANGAAQVRYLLADDNGCYLLAPQGSELVTEWYLTNDDYLFLTGRRLQAVSIQRLSQADFFNGQFYPRYLIVNRFSGEDNIPDVFGFPGTPRGEITGEVFEIRSVDFFQGGYRTAQARLYRPAGRFLERNPDGAIQWMVPNETIPMRRLFPNSPLIPVPGKIQRTIGSADGGTTTYTLDQPTFAERPF